MFDWQSDCVRKVAETIVRHIDNTALRELLRKRGFGWQATHNGIDESNEITASSDLVNDICRYVVKSNVHKALLDTLKKEDLVKLATIATDSQYEYSLSDDSNEMLDTILSVHGFAFPQKESLFSIGQYRTQVTKIKERLLQYEKDGDIPDGTLRGLSLDGWSGLESLLVLMLLFFEEAFVEHDGFKDAGTGLPFIVDTALNLSGLGSLIRQGLKDVASYIIDGDHPSCRQTRFSTQNDEKQKIRDKVNEQVKKETHNFIKAYWSERKAEFAKVDAGWDSEDIRKLKDTWDTKMSEGRDSIVEKWRIIEAEELAQLEILWAERQRANDDIGRQNLTVFRGLLRQHLNRDSLFESSMLDNIASLTFHRNIYAHRDSSQLQWLGIDHVISSINALIGVIDLLERNNLCPELIYVIGVGRDAYGRESVYFIRDSDFDPTEPVRPTNIRWMYKAQNLATPFRPYYLLTSQHYGAYDPFMIDATIISNKLKKWQQNRR